MLDYQEQFYNEEIKLIVGVDEAGRGPLAGPVVASAVILPRAYINNEINDSKQLSEKKREKLYKEIMENAIAVGIGIVDAALPIAAASIIAKVTRDHMMVELDKQYPQYGFKEHKGYGTKKHMEALKQYGPIDGIHRFSYNPVFEIAYIKPLF